MYLICICEGLERPMAPPGHGPKILSSSAKTPSAWCGRPYSTLWLSSKPLAYHIRIHSRLSGTHRGTDLKPGWPKLCQVVTYPDPGRFLGPPGPGFWLLVLFTSLFDFPYNLASRTMNSERCWGTWPFLCTKRLHKVEPDLRKLGYNWLARLHANRSGEVWEGPQGAQINSLQASKDHYPKNPPPKPQS